MDFQAKNGVLYGDMTEIKNGRLQKRLTGGGVLFNHIVEQFQLESGAFVHFGGMESQDSSQNNTAVLATFSLEEVHSTLSAMFSVPVSL